MVAFSQISPSKRIPLVYLEFNASGAGAGQDFVNPTVLLGQMLEGSGAGTAVEGQRYLVTSAGQAAALFGRGSVLHVMCRAYLRQNPDGVLYAIAAGDAASATAASKTLTWVASSALAGTITLYINAVKVTAAVTAGMTAAQIATAVVNAITANADLEVTAAVGSGGSEHILTVTAKCKGTVGNQITVKLNALGPNAGEVLPSGVTCTVSGELLASGATDNADTVWTNVLGDDAYDVLVPQYNVMLGALQTEVASRWTANRGLGGQIYSVAGDSQADLLTLAGTENDPYTSILGFKEAAGWLSPGYEIAAAYAGVAARELAADPAIPLQTLPLVGIWGNGANFSDAERDQLANGGIATCVARNGQVLLEFEATTKREDAFGDEDHTFDVVQTPATLQRMGRRFKARIQSRYPRHKLADDGTPIPAGSRVVTPQILRGELIAEYADMVGNLAEDLAAFRGALVVERNPDNPNRVDAYIPPDLINQFRVFAGNITFTV